MSPTTCSKQLLPGSIAIVHRSTHEGSTDDKWRSSDDNDSMRVSCTPAQPARYGSGNHMAAAVKGLLQPTSRDGYVAPSMGVAPRSIHGTYVTKKMSSSTYHRMRDPGAAVNTAPVQERNTRRPMQGGTGAYTKEKPTTASYMPPHVRLRLGPETAASTTSMSLLEGMAAKPRATHLHEGSKHKDYGDHDSRSHSVMT